MLRTARHQRVAPLVLRALEAAGIDADDAGARREAAFRRAQELVALPLVAEHALRPLDEAGLTPLVHKGAALVERYPGPGLRPMDDVDLLVPADQAQAAVAVLEAAGWRRGVHSVDLPDPGYDVPMVHREAVGLPIELHRELQRRGQRTSGVDAALLWAGRRASSVAGRRAWGVAPELELLVLATHAAKPFHVFSRLIWAVDIAVVAGAGGLDWDLVARRAQELRCATAVAVAGRLGRRLGAAVPDEVTALSGIVERTGALDALLDPRWPFVMADHNRRGLALALVDGGLARSRLVLDEVLHRDDGRSRARTVADIAGAAGRFARRVATRRA